MEWDFLGLNSKNVAMPLPMPLKEEFQDNSKNSGMFMFMLLRSSIFQFPCRKLKFRVIQYMNVFLLLVRVFFKFEFSEELTGKSVGEENQVCRGVFECKF